MCSCSTYEGNREKIGKIFVEGKMDVLQMNETKMRGKDKCKFGCVERKMSGMDGGKASEGVALLLSPEVQICMYSSGVETSIIKADVGES